MDILARAQPAVDAAREELPALQQAFRKIAEIFKNIWAKLTDTGIFSKMIDYVKGLFGIAVDSSQPVIDRVTEAVENGVSEVKKVAEDAAVNVDDTTPLLEKK